MFCKFSLQYNITFCSFTRFTENFDISSMNINNILTHRQTDTRTSLLEFIMLLALIESLKQMRQFFLRNTFTCVLYRHCYGIGIIRYIYTYTSSLWGIFECI